jgi:O-antigen ligase
MVAAFDLIGRDLPWAPLSMSRSGTWLSAVALLPPLSIYLGVIQLRRRERRLLSLALLALGLAGIFVGLLQVAQGSSSPLQFYGSATQGFAVGFFANRNHFAANIYSLMPLAAAWIVSGADGVAARVIGFAVFLTLIAAELMARSRAGVVLTIVALFGAIALARSGHRLVKGITPVRLFFSAAALAIVFSLRFALYRILERFDVDVLADARIAIARNTIEAAISLMPVGAGQGAFVPVYAMFEKPQDLIAGTYVNHAHNEFLQLWLESGVAAPILIGAFAIWFVLRSASVWRRSYHDGLEIDRSLTRAASLIIALLAAHSIVDYPLRTGSMMAVLAFACALLIDPPISSPEEQREFELDEEQTPKRRRRLGEPMLARATLEQASAPPLAAPEASSVPFGSNPSAGEETIKWPKEWGT